MASRALHRAVVGDGALMQRASRVFIVVVLVAVAIVAIVVGSIRRYGNQ